MLRGSEKKKKKEVQGKMVIVAHLSRLFLLWFLNILQAQIFLLLDDY